MKIYIVEQSSVGMPYGNSIAAFRGWQKAFEHFAELRDDLRIAAAANNYEVDDNTDANCISYEVYDGNDFPYRRTILQLITLDMKRR